MTSPPASRMRTGAGIEHLDRRRVGRARPVERGGHAGIARRAPVGLPALGHDDFHAGEVAAAGRLGRARHQAHPRGVQLDPRRGGLRLASRAGSGAGATAASSQGNGNSGVRALCMASPRCWRQHRALAGAAQFNTPRSAMLSNSRSYPFQVPALLALVSSHDGSKQRPQGQNGGYLDGQLLIAMPCMSDKRFARSVIYMCAHSAQGAMGLIVNQRAPHISFPELLGQLSIAEGDGARLKPAGARRRGRPRGRAGRDRARLRAAQLRLFCGRLDAAHRRRASR